MQPEEFADDAFISIGDKQFSVNRRYTKTEIRRAVTENYRKKLGVEERRPLPKGALKQIQMEFEEFMRQMEAAQAAAKETP
jgi:hypothetical protein